MDDRAAAINEYRVQVIICHLVAAAQSLIRARFPDRVDDNDYRQTPVISMRDISIGSKDEANKNQRLVVACHEQPGTIIEAHEFDPNGDISSDDGMELYEGNSTAERELICLSD